MKNFKFLLTAVILVFSAGLISLMAQSPTEVIDSIGNADSWFDLFHLEDAILGASILIGGYLIKLIPGLNAIPSTAYAVFTLAIILVSGFVLFGASSIQNGTVIYALVTSVYELILKPLSKE